MGFFVDPGENDHQALIREINEEGWNLDETSAHVDDEPFFTKEIGGFDCRWYRFWDKSSDLKPHFDYKEKHRGIFPIFTHPMHLSGLGNEEAYVKYRTIFSPWG